MFLIASVSSCQKLKRMKTQKPKTLYLKKKKKWMFFLLFPLLEISFLWASVSSRSAVGRLMRKYCDRICVLKLTVGTVSVLSFLKGILAGRRQEVEIFSPNVFQNVSTRGFKMHQSPGKKVNLLAHWLTNARDSQERAALGGLLIDFFWPMPLWKEAAVTESLKRSFLLVLLGFLGGLEIRSLTEFLQEKKKLKHARN